MAAIITEKFRLNNAKQFVEDITQSSSVAYSFIGRGHSWTDDATPPTPVDSPNDEFDAYRNMVAMKKISTSDISHAIVRRDWATGTTYDEYRHNYTSANAANSGATTLWSSLFYVITDDYNVYKCLHNDGNTASTVKPDHTSLATPTESDGYQWKFMFSISASDVIKYVTNDFLPVKTIGAKLAVAGGVDTGSQDGRLGDAATDDGSAQWDIENGAVDGALQRVRVVAAGSGYTASTTTASIVIRGDGTGGRATVVSNSGGGVATCAITTAGSGYTTAFLANEDIPGFDNANQAANGTNASANIEFIIQPKNGHGSDAVEELGGNYIILNSRLEYAEGSGDFPTDNDFRRIGLVQDPFNNGSTTVSTAASMTAYSQMTLSSASGLSPDDLIRDSSSDVAGTAVSRIVSINGTVISHIPVANSEGGYFNFAAADVVYTSAGANVGTVSAVSGVHPEVEHYTGQIMYIENRGAVTRAADQIEDIKLIIEM